MKAKRITALLVAMSMTIIMAFAQTIADRNEYYKSLSSESGQGIDEVLQKLETEKQTSAVKAYYGALLMKKAGFVKGVNGKVKTFKKGAHMLENEIEANQDNTEYRFLRLTIQENAPGILNYHKNLEQDKEAIITSFKKLDSTLKGVIADYAKSSKILKLTDLEH